MHQQPPPPPSRQRNSWALCLAPGTALGDITCRAPGLGGGGGPGSGTPTSLFRAQAGTVTGAWARSP